MKKYLVGAALVAASLLPAFAFAQGINGNSPVTVTTSNLDTAISNITQTVNKIVPLLLAVAVVVFIWGVIRYIIAKGPEDAKKGRNLIIWSVVGLAAILAVWGLAGLLINFFGLSTGSVNQNSFPTIPTNNIPNTFSGPQT